MGYCHSCGDARTASDARFCATCGSSLMGAPDAGGTDASVPHELASATPAELRPAEARRGGRTVTAAVAAAALVAVAGTGAFVFLGGNGRTSAASSAGQKPAAEP